MSTNKITFLLNWEAAPYHIPVYLANIKGYFKDENLDIAILSPPIHLMLLNWWDPVKLTWV